MTAPLSTSSTSSGEIKFQARDFITSRRLQPQDQTELESFYKLGPILGEGSFGRVYRGTHLESGQERAVKIVAKSQDDPQRNEDVFREFQILRYLDHPYLIKVYELLEDDDNFYIITEICEGGDLLDAIEERGYPEEADAAEIIHNLLYCINYCHQQGVCHLDLKLDNLLLHEDGSPSSGFGNIKVIDFGFARPLHHGEQTRFQNEVGTPYYVAPQVLNGDYNYKCDIWSIGVIAYMLLGGYAPFDGDDDNEVMRNVLRGEFDFDSEQWDYVSDEAKAFIQFLLIYDENLRPSAEEALQHEWLCQFREYKFGSSSRRSTSTRLLNEQQGSASCTTNSSPLARLPYFQSQGMLKQATCAMLASRQQHCQDVQHIRHAFQRLDRECCGKLSRENVQEGLLHVLFPNGSCDPKVDLNYLFDQINVSGSGSISYSEFVGACLMTKMAAVDDGGLIRKQMFLAFDKECKGCITSSNIWQVLSTNSRPMSDVAIAAIIGEVDRTGYGVITFNDYNHMMIGCSRRPSLPLPSSPPPSQKNYIEIGPRQYQSQTSIPLQFGATVA